MSEHVLHAYALDGNGGGTPLSLDSVSEHTRSNEQLTWVHLDANYPETREWLVNELTYLDPLVVEALLEDV